MRFCRRQRVLSCGRLYQYHVGVGFRRRRGSGYFGLLLERIVSRKNGYALTYSVSAIKTEAEPSKTWACPVRCVKDVK